jgi:hypothetical protein
MAESVGALTQLTHLALSMYSHTVSVHDWCCHLAPLAALASLSIDTLHATGSEERTDADFVSGAKLTDLLSGMTQLTSLSLQGGFALPNEVEAGVVAALSRLPHLSLLQLHASESFATPVVAGKTPGRDVPGYLLASATDLPGGLCGELSAIGSYRAEKVSAEQAAILNRRAGRALFQ